MYVEHPFYQENKSFMKNNYTKNNITFYYLRSNIYILLAKKVT